MMALTLLTIVLAGGDAVKAGPPSSWSLEPVPGNGVRLFGAHDDFDQGVWVAGRFSLETFPFESRNFIARWDGAQWIETSAPQPAASEPDKDHSLASIAALAENDAIAVGSHDALDANVTVPQSMRWNGSEWSLLDAPAEIVNSGNGSGGFADVSKTGETAWAVGDFPGIAASGADVPIVQFFATRLDGDQWDVRIPPLYDQVQNQGLARYLSSAVAGVNGDDVWLGGRVQQVGEGPDGPVLVHWDGLDWTWHDIWPLFETNIADIEDIAALASDDVWAVGEETVFENITSRSVAVILHWNGTQWQRIAAPDEADRNVALRTIVARTPTEIYAAGLTWTSDGPPEGYLLHYDGQTWSSVPDVELAGESQFFASAIGSSGHLWLAGRANGLPLQGLAQMGAAGSVSLFRDRFEQP